MRLNLLSEEKSLSAGSLEVYFLVTACSVHLLFYVNHYLFIAFAGRKG